MEGLLARVVERSASPPPFTLKPYMRPRPQGWRRYTPAAALALLAFVCLPYGFYYALTTPYLLVPMAAPLGVLLGLVIWALPDTRSKPLFGIEALLLAYAAAILIWPNYIAISLPGLPWITVARLFGFPLAFLYLVSLSTSAEFRTANELIHRNSIPVWVFIAVLFVIQVLSTPLAKEHLAAVQKLVIWQINLTLIFFISAYVFSKERRCDQWLYLLLVASIILSIVGIIESREHRILWAGHIPSFLRVDTDSVSGILSGSSRAATGVYRVKGTASTALGLSELIALTMPFIIHMAIGRFGLVTRMLAAGAVPLLIYVVVATDSRLGMVGTIMSVLLYFAAWTVLRWRRNKRDLFAPALLFAAPFIVAIGFMATLFIRRLRLMVWGGGAQQASNQARIDQIDKGLPMIVKNPLGHGPGQAAETLGYHGGGGVLTIDNYYLSIGLEYGVIGFIAFYGMFLFVAWNAAKQASLMGEQSERDFDLFVPLAISLLNFVVIKSVFSQQENHSLVFMMLGMAVALTYRYQKSRATASTLNSRKS